MLSIMNLKKVKCICEQLCIIIFLLIILNIIGRIFLNLLFDIFSIVSNNVRNIIFGFLTDLYKIASTILVLIHIFRIRYLDYYNIICNKKQKEIHKYCGKKQ